MSHTKQSAKRKHRRTAVPLLGAAGLSLSLASGASGAPAANIATRHADMSQEFILAEEEVSDVSLATFYVFDKENAGPFRPSVLLARGGCGGGGAAEAAVVEAAVAVAASGDVQAVAVAVLALEDAEGVEAALALEAAAAGGEAAAEVAVCRGEVATTARRSPRHDVTALTTRAREGHRGSIAAETLGSGPRASLQQFRSHSCAAL
jgi:hypothetical protein